MCVPLVTRAVKGKSTPWINDDIREAMEDRNRLQLELKIDTSNSRLRNVTKIAKKHVNKLINKTRVDHHHDRLKDSKGNISATWNVIGEIIPSQKNNIMPIILITSAMKPKSSIVSFLVLENPLLNAHRKN